MKVCGFTFIRNAVKFDYPVLEAITSVLPLCDEFIIVAGNSEDETNQLLLSLDSKKIRIVNSIWDDTLRTGGKVLALETNKAIDLLPADADWGFYIQADEVLHEKFYDPVRESMLKYKDNLSVEGLLFEYLHFYGSYDFIGSSTRWYRNEVRIIRCDKSIRSFRDAQGFKKNGKSLHVMKSNACIYHYGWVKPPAMQQEKQKYFHSLWHSDTWLKQNIAKEEVFDYSGIDSLERFKGAHPGVMAKRIQQSNWTFSFDPTTNKHSFKSKVKIGIEKLTGWRPGEYKNYKLLK